MNGLAISAVHSLLGWNNIIVLNVIASFDIVIVVLEEIASFDLNIIH
jgi:hypothetical protein